MKSKGNIENLWWKRGLKNPCLGRRRTNEEIDKTAKSHTISPTLSPSDNLAYFLGAFLGDGCAYSNKKKHSYSVYIYPGLCEGFANKCSNCLKEIGLNPHIYLRKSPSLLKRGYRPQWMVTCYSKVFVEWLQGLSLEKLGKMLTSDELKLEFVRGFADAEGTTSVKRKSVRLAISNIDKELIKFVAKLLKDLGLHPNIHKTTSKNKKWKPLYYVTLTRNNEATMLLEGMIKGEKIFKKQAEFELSPTFWTDEEIKTLKAEYSEDFRGDATKDLPKRSRQAIRTKAYELGLKRKTTKYSREEVKDKLHDMYWNKNYSIDEIGEELGIGAVTAWGYLKRFGIPLRSTSESRTRRATVKLFCLWCKKDFLVRKWVADKGRKFCSRDCQLEYYKNIGVPKVY